MFFFFNRNNQFSRKANRTFHFNAARTETIYTQQKAYLMTLLQLKCLVLPELPWWQGWFIKVARPLSAETGFTWVKMCEPGLILPQIYYSFYFSCAHPLPGHKHPHSPFLLISWGLQLFFLMCIQGKIQQGSGMRFVTFIHSFVRF